MEIVNIKNNTVIDVSSFVFAGGEVQIKLEN